MAVNMRAPRCQYAEAHYEWELENFFETIEGDRGYCYQSADFQFSGITFEFCLLPMKESNCILLCLMLIERNLTVKIRYTLGIKTAAGDTEVWKSGTHEFSGLHYFVDHQQCMERSELLNRRQQLAPCDVLTITANLKIDVSRPDMGTTEAAVQTSVEDVGGQAANGGHEALENTDFVNLAQSLKDLYVAGKDCDVTLEVKDKKFRAHRLILGARTPVLAAMFSHDTTEAETGIVRVEDCDPEAFEVFLGFVYSCTAENVTGENVANVYYVADKYDLPGLKKECVRHMLSNLTTGTVCNVIALAERHGEELLQERATEFFVENARETFRTASWRKFLAENSSLAYELINRVHEN